jgi:hypothetical protein
MKITTMSYSSTDFEFDSIDQAVKSRISDRGLAEGELETLREKCDRLEDVLSKLVQCIYEDEQKTKEKALEFILGYGYKVE